jgi:hypothetical protein
MALDEHTKDRLENWKFASAQTSLRDQSRVGFATPTEVELDTVNALSSVFGNCGWFDGDLGCVVRAAVMFLASESPGSVEWDRSVAEWRDSFRAWLGKMPPPPNV